MKISSFNMGIFMNDMLIMDKVDIINETYRSFDTKYLSQICTLHITTKVILINTKKHTFFD